MAAIDMSRTRRRLAVRMLRAQQILTRTDLDADSRLLYAVGLLCADDDGRVSESDLAAAVSDPEIVNVARQIMLKAAS